MINNNERIPSYATLLLFVHLRCIKRDWKMGLDLIISECEVGLFCLRLCLQVYLNYMLKRHRLLIAKYLRHLMYVFRFVVFSRVYFLHRVYVSVQVRLDSMLNNYLSFRRLLPSFDACFLVGLVTLICQTLHKLETRFTPALNLFLWNSS